MCKWTQRKRDVSTEEWQRCHYSSGNQAPVVVNYFLIAKTKIYSSPYWLLPLLGLALKNSYSWQTNSSTVGRHSYLVSYVDNIFKSWNGSRDRSSLQYREVHQSKKYYSKKKKVREISFNPWVVDWTKAAHLE